MSLAAEVKVGIVGKYCRHTKDTGSPEVQIALLTAEIKQLTDHLKRNPKDLHSRMGLIGKVSLRRRLLKYLKASNFDVYAKVINELGIRK